MKIRIATEVIKNILISSVILYLSYDEIKNKIKERDKHQDFVKTDFDDDYYESDDFKKSFLDDNDLFKKTDFE